MATVDPATAPVLAGTGPVRAEPSAARHWAATGLLEITGVPFAVRVILGASAVSTAVAGVRSCACTAAVCSPSPATSRPKIAATGRATSRSTTQHTRSRAWLRIQAGAQESCPRHPPASCAGTIFWSWLRHDRSH